MEHSRLKPRQLIDHDKQFKKQSILQIAELLKNTGRQYYSIAIIGVQNSGKSTLLNLLFGTNFDVLQGTIRNKTTKGILASLDKEKDFIVLDVQGNDAIDNANDKEYEKMVSTYALSMANVLIINVWQKTIGQNTGTQFDTLQTIMKICVNEFRQEAPKTILFCMRDSNPRRVQDSQDRILRQVNKIWEKIQDKPQKFKHLSTPQLFLKIKFFSLPPYNFGNSQQFKENIDELRQKFTDPSNKDYIFAYQDPKFNLPITDLPQLSQKAWQSIKNNEILNLPGEKIQLASFRCERISAKQEKKFQIKLLKAFLYSKIAMRMQSSISPPNIGDIIHESENAYDHQAYLYDQKVAKQKKTKMVEIMKDYSHKYAIDLIHFKMTLLKEEFESKMSASKIKVLREQYQKQINYNKKTLPASANDYIEQLMENIVDFIKKLKYQFAQRKAKLDNFDKQLKQIFKSRQKKINQDIKQQMQHKCSQQFKMLAINVIQTNLQNDFWAKCTEKFNAKISKIYHYYQQLYHWVQLEQLDELDLRFKKEEEFKKQIENKLRDTFNQIMEEIFKKKMSIDEDNHKINYNIMTQDQIDELYSSARLYVLGLIYKINAPKSMIRNSFIDTPDEQEQSFAFAWIKGSVDNLEKHMMEQYEKIIRRKKQSQMRKVPIWLFGLMVFFVYDDLWFSQAEYPFLHYLLLTILIIVLIMFALGKGHILSDVVHSLADKVSFLK